MFPVFNHIVRTNNSYARTFSLSSQLARSFSCCQCCAAIMFQAYLVIHPWHVCLCSDGVIRSSRFAELRCFKLQKKKCHDCSVRDCGAYLSHFSLSMLMHKMYTSWLQQTTVTTNKFTITAGIRCNRVWLHSVLSISHLELCWWRRRRIILKMQKRSSWVRHAQKFNNLLPSKGCTSCLHRSSCL